jgi:hypothetical protein
LMMRLADRLRYRGPILSATDLARLASDSGPDSARARLWHAQVLRFRGDRPLPPDFRSGPVRWQLDTLAWSFHVDLNSRQSAAEVPHALARELALADAARPSQLALQYPALAAYVEFLAKLPRK